MLAAIRVLITHLLSVAVMLVVMAANGESPRVFVYGFFFSYFYRLLTLQGLLELHASGSAHGRWLARALSRPPHRARPAFPVTVGEGAGAVPGKLKDYLVVVAICACFTFFLINMEDHEIATPTRVIVDELLHGFLAAALWWALDLIDRRLTIRFSDPLWANFGYNSTQTTLLAVTVLTGGLASALTGSPWPYLLTLIAFKTWSDVWDESKFPRGEHPPEPGRVK